MIPVLYMAQDQIARPPQSMRRVSYLAQHEAGEPVKSVPFIRLSGAWMQDHGFNIGSQFSLSTEGGKITLTPINLETANA